MINKQMSILIEKRKNIDPQNEYQIQQCWDEELDVLTVSLENTINYLNQASEEEILWVSEIFDDLVVCFKSKLLIDIYRAVQTKYPNISKDIEIDIRYAEEIMKNVG